MTFSDEMLMAYVDRELDAATTAAIDAAIARDAELAARIERQRRLRLSVHAAFEPVLAEPMPKRLLDAASGAASERTTRAVATPRRWAWFEWGAMAASLALGVLIGGAFIGDSRRGPPVVAGAAADLVAERGQLLARGTLARALFEQLASTQRPDAPIRIGLTFVSGAGEYCRTFSFEQRAAAAGLSGLACTDANEWRIQVIAQADRARATSEYRMAGADLPAEVLRAVQDRMQGGTLDAEAERAAQRRGWKR